MLATGKTQASIEVALYLADKYRLKAEIVNFDSLLFYKELNIGTAKPTPDEQKGILHHLVNIRSINDPINASDFIKLAYDKIEELQEKNIIPILVGGSAFYIRALVKGMIHSIETPEISDMIKKEIQQIKLTPNGIINFLTEKDPEIFNHIHKNDDYRLTRAAEFLQNLKPYSVEIKKTVKNKPYDFSHNNKINGTMLHLSMLVDKVTHLKKPVKIEHQIFVRKRLGRLFQLRRKVNKKYIIISGATATGRAKAVLIALYRLQKTSFKAEIVNLCNLLFYKNLI